ncbi:MAG: phage baseplate assembly protein V [Pseudomonadota bacterium]
MRQAQADAGRRATQTMARGVLRKTDSAKKMQRVDVSILKDERKDSVEHWEAYGLTAVPMDGAEALVAFPSGERSHAVVVAIGDRRYRLTGLQSGEVALYDHQGQRVLLGAAGITIDSAKTVTVKSAEKVIVEADRIFLGGEAGAVAVMTAAGPSTRVFAKV